MEKAYPKRSAPVNKYFDDSSKYSCTYYLVFSVTFLCTIVSSFQVVVMKTTFKLFVGLL